GIRSDSPWWIRSSVEFGRHYRVSLDHLCPVGDHSVAMPFIPSKAVRRAQETKPPCLLLPGSVSEPVHPPLEGGSLRARSVWNQQDVGGRRPPLQKKSEFRDRN